MELAQGNQVADHTAKRATLQKNDLIGVATLHPQTDLPETLSYTEGETLKAKSEGFQDHTVVPKRGTPFSVQDKAASISVPDLLKIGQRIF